MTSRSTMLALVAGMGCGGRPASQPLVTVRDSAGVRIVENSAAALQHTPMLRLAPTARVVIGRTDGPLPYVFGNVSGAIRLANGRIVVADAQADEVRFFDPSGRFLFHVGRKGKGPGEYEFIRDVRHYTADSIAVFDLSWQLTVYDSNGALGRTLRLTEPGSDRTPYQLSCSRTGAFLISGWGAQTLQPHIGLYRSFAPISELDGGGTLLLDLGTYPSSERIGSQYGSMPHPFGKTTELAIGHDAIYIGTADHFAIDVFDLQGRLERIVRGPEGDLTITPEEIARYRERRMAAAPPSARPRIARAVRDMPHLDTFPAYTALRLDPAGRLWVERFARPTDDARHWIVFAPDGRVVERVVLPLNFRVTDIGNEWVLGITRDSLDVQRVALYQLAGG